MRDRRFLLKLLEVHDLPTLPVVLNSILKTVADENSSADDLTDLIERDHAISARVVRLANSAFYGLRLRVNSIRQGITVLGFNETRNLALAASVFDTLAKRRQFALDPEDFWMHSFGVAAAAQIVSEKHLREGDREGCFTAGLLHDIGKYVLALVLKEEYRQIVEEAIATKQALSNVEAAQLGMTHSEVGKWLAEKWNFPPIIGNVIAHVDRAHAYTGADRRTVAAVAIGDLLARRAQFGSAGDPDDAVNASDVLKALDLSQAQFDSLAAELSPLRDETRQLLGVLGQDL